MMITDIERAIKKRDTQFLMVKMFHKNRPVLRKGFKTENEFWDFKKTIPRRKNDTIAWAQIAKHILGFHNYKGGLIIFGIDDKSFKYYGLTEIYDSKLFNDKIRKYIGDSIFVEFQRIFISEDQKYLGVALIPPRGPRIEKFKCNSPERGGKKFFLKNGTAIRNNDSTKVLSPEDAVELIKLSTSHKVGNIYEIDEPCYKILAPEYKFYIERDNMNETILKALQDIRYSTVSIKGIGGVGKTATATSIALEAYKLKIFDYIVSVTAKDRELTQKGIQPLIPTLSSFENLLDNILDVLDFSEYKSFSTEKKHENVMTILEKSNCLLFVDNLETVDDVRIIEFLNQLPVGVKALVTSRRSKIKFSVYPIELRPFNMKECRKYITKISNEIGFNYAQKLINEQMDTIGSSCDGIPLAIRWIMSSSDSIQELRSKAIELSNSGHKGEELLEFSFRRVFSSMTEDEIIVLKIISLFNDAITKEMIFVASELENYKLEDAIDNLLTDTFIYRLFDEEKNDYCYTTLSILKKFINNQIEETDETKYRKRLSRWFNADDIKDKKEKALVLQFRQSNTKTVSNILDLYKTSLKRNDLEGAEDFLLNALNKFRNNHKILSALGDFYKRKKLNIKNALKYYSAAVQYAPSTGRDKAIIHREYAFSNLKSGLPTATKIAIQHLKIALDEFPDDRLAKTSLAQIYSRQGKHDLVISLVSDCSNCNNQKTVSMVVPLLQKAYEYNNEIVKLAELKNKFPTYIR